ncbi:MAG: tetratricopeptide repeat protein [Oligoflexia bacterium]|nr:tetratricopeptide repeat protein [Oligoflexia bacterium]
MKDFIFDSKGMDELFKEVYCSPDFFCFPCFSENNTEEIKKTYLLGINEFHKANFEDAIRFFSQLVTPNGGLEIAGYWLGQCYYHQSRYEEMINVYTDLLSKFPQWCLVEYHLGLAFYLTAQDQNAIKCFEHLLQKKNSNVFTYIYLAEIYFRHGKLLEAINTVKEGLTLNQKAKNLKKALDFYTDVSKP